MSVEIYTKLIFLVGLSFTSFGLLAYTRIPRTFSNKLFGLLSISFALWSFSWFFMLVYAQNDSVALFWARTLNFGAVWIPIFYSHWLLSLLGLQTRRRVLIICGYSISLIFSLFAFTPFFIKGVHPIFFFPVWPDPGILYIWFIGIAYIGVVGAAIVLIVHKFSGLSRSERYLMLYVLIGSVLGFGGGATNFFAMYNLSIITPTGLFLGALGVLVAPYFFAYSALRYGLMNVKIIFTEAFAAILVLIFVARSLTSETNADLAINILTLASATVFVYLLVKSVMREVEQREKIESLATELSFANTELKKLDAAKSEFISIAGHQLRTPLTVIKGYTSMVLEGSFGKIPDSIKEALNRVLISSGALAKLVTDLLDLSRIESGKIRYEFKEVNMEAIVYGVMRELEETAKVKNIPLIYKNENAADPRLIGDFDKLHEVVINIVDNAIKYSDHGSVELVLRKSGSGENPRLALSVKDNGIGVKPEDIPKLFGKFVRSEDAKKIRPDGMGLGLYLAKRIVEDHKGRIKVESPGLGRGSIFTVEFPAL